MKTKSIRIPKEMAEAIGLVEREEHIEESTAMRKLIRMRFETYVGNLTKRERLLSDARVWNSADDSVRISTGNGKPNSITHGRRAAGAARPSAAFGLLHVTQASQALELFGIQGLDDSF